MVGPDGILINVNRCLRTIGITWLTDLFNKIWKENEMPNDRRSNLVPIYNNKGDVQDCSKYRRIQLIYAYKVMGKSDRYV